MKIDFVNPYPNPPLCEVVSIDKIRLYDYFIAVSGFPVGEKLTFETFEKNANKHIYQKITDESYLYCNDQVEYKRHDFIGYNCIIIRQHVFQFEPIMVIKN